MRPSISVKVLKSVIERARVIAAHKRVSLGDYLSDTLDRAMDADFAEMVEELNEARKRGGNPEKGGKGNKGGKSGPASRPPPDGIGGPPDGTGGPAAGMSATVPRPPSVYLSHNLPRPPKVRPGKKQGRRGDGLANGG